MSGFGLAGGEDLSGNAQVGLGYAVGNSTQINLSWRCLGIAFDNGGDPKPAVSEVKTAKFAIGS